MAFKHIFTCAGSIPINSDGLGIVGSLGSLIFDEMSPLSPLTLLHGEFEQQGNQFIPVNQRQEVLELETGEPLQRVCDRFITSILKNTPSVVSSGWVGTELVEILCCSDSISSARRSSLLF